MAVFSSSPSTRGTGVKTIYATTKSPGMTDSILSSIDPSKHPFNPGNDASPCEIINSNQYETFVVGVGAGSIANVPVTLNTPRRIIIYKGNSQGGSTTGVMLSFVPLGNDGGSPIIFDRESVMLNAIPFITMDALATSLRGSIWQYAKFCKPVTRFFISTSDTGQPGENLIFMAADDFDMFST